MSGLKRSRTLIFLILILSLAVAVCGLDHAGSMGHGGTTAMNCAANFCTTLISSNPGSPVKADGFFPILILAMIPGLSFVLLGRNGFLQTLFDSGGPILKSSGKIYRLQSVFRI